MDAHISVRNLNVFYGKKQVLNNVNFDIPRNQITVILGPSGCGKSTVLKSLNRFIDLENGAQVQGCVLFDGIDLYGSDIDVTKVRTKIGLLAQKPYPLPMSIFDNVAYGLRIHGRQNDRNLRKTVQGYLEQSGLWEEVKDRLNDPASALSIGQQQRLCLARGLAVEPEILLGDEPTSALDPISAKNFDRQLQVLKQQYTVVLVTHILRQAKLLADTIVFMYMGEVVEWGPAQELLTNPRQTRTREYLSGGFY